MPKIINRPGLITTIPLVAGLLLFVGATDGWSQGKGRGGPRASKVGVDMVRPAGDLAESRRFVAHFRNAWSGRVATRIAGAVDLLSVSVGDRVTKGDVLAVLGSENRRSEVAAREADLAESRAALAAAKAGRELNETELKRLEALRGSSAFRQQTYDEKRIEQSRLRAEVSRNEAAIARARATLNQAKLALAWSEIKAPFDGVVTALSTSPGDFVNAGAQIVELQSDEGMSIEADVPVADLALLSPGMVMDVERSDGLYQGIARLKAVVPVENALARTVPVRFDIVADDLPKPPRAGEALILQASIQAPAGQASLHKDAIVWTGRGATVFLVEAGKAKKVTVTLGAAIGDRFLVVDGVQEGDWLVTRGNERLRPGASVESPDLPQDQLSQDQKS